MLILIISVMMISAAITMAIVMATRAPVPTYTTASTTPVMAATSIVFVMPITTVAVTATVTAPIFGWSPVRTW